MTETSRETDDYSVTPLELFFDLVFVFAISRLSHHLIDDLTWHGLAETLVMLLTIGLAWNVTSWSATIFCADRGPTQRLVIGVMALALIQSAVIQDAFGVSGWIFALIAIAIFVGRALWMQWHVEDGFFREHYRSVMIWTLATVPLWLMGAIASPDARLWWWAGAIAVELAGAGLGHPLPGRRMQPEGAAFDAAHFLERCRLFLIIALGESITLIGVTLADRGLTPLNLLTGMTAFAGIVAIWGLQFGSGKKMSEDAGDTTGAPIALAIRAVRSLAVLIAALVGIAVANELILDEPLQQPGPAVVALLSGGAILILLAQAVYLRVYSSRHLHLRLAGVAALALVGWIGLLLPAWLFLLLVVTVLGGVALIERRDGQRLFMKRPQ